MYVVACLRHSNVANVSSPPRPPLFTYTYTRWKYIVLPAMSLDRLDLLGWYVFVGHFYSRAHFSYYTGFEQRTEVANWVNVAALATTCLLLLSFLVLPTKWTHRHYLSVCLAIGVGCIEVSG